MQLSSESKRLVLCFNLLLPLVFTTVFFGCLLSFPKIVRFTGLLVIILGVIIGNIKKKILVSF